MNNLTTKQKKAKERIKKPLLTEEEKLKIREVLPSLLKLQREFRGMASLYPDYREPKYAPCFIHESGAPIHEDFGLYKFIEIEVKI